MQFFSASQLVKSSAKQILYLRDKPKPPPSENMKQGESYAASVSVSPYVEMGGKFEHKDLRICFSVDEAFPSNRKIHLYEHKSVRTDDLWYIRNSLIQTALYGALARHVQDLYTAGYHNGIKHHIDMRPYLKNDKIHSFLNYGGIVYRVNPVNNEDIIRFFLTKARASLDWNLAKRFDNEYHHQEWEKYFRKLIKYRKV